MASTVELRVSRRPGDGKGEARKLRRAGRVPGVAYGPGLESTPVAVDSLELQHALNTDAGLNAILKLDLDGDEHLAIAREVQRHPSRREVQHIDFVTVTRGVEISVEVPLELTGEDDRPASRDGAVLEVALHSLPVSVLPLSVPDQIVVDVSELEAGDVLRVGDLDLPEGVTPEEPEDRTVVTATFVEVDVPEVGEEAAEDAEEPEVVGEAGDADEGAEAGDAGEED